MVELIHPEVVIGCDDGRVTKLGEGFTLYACLAFDLNTLKPIGASIGLVRVDGLEASSLIAYSLARASGGKKSVLLLDSLTIAGFNVVSPASIAKLTGSPVIVVYSYKPSFARLARGIEKTRYPHLRSRVLKVVDDAREASTRWGPVWILPWGIGFEEALKIVDRTQVYSRTPEPVRIAHMIASEVSRGLLE